MVPDSMSPIKRRISGIECYPEGKGRGKPARYMAGAIARRVEILLLIIQYNGAYRYMMMMRVMKE